MHYLLENTAVVKFIRNYIRDFSISSLVKISMTSLMSCLTLKPYLDLLVYDRNIFGSSSKAFGNLRKSRKMFRNVCVVFGQFLEIFGKWSEIFGKQPKTSLSVCLYNKQNNTWLLVDMKYLFSYSTLYLTRSLHSLVRYRVEHSKTYSISTYAHVLSSIYYIHKLNCALYETFNQFYVQFSGPVAALVRSLMNCWIPFERKI